MLIPCVLKSIDCGLETRAVPFDETGTIRPFPARLKPPGGTAPLGGLHVGSCSPPSICGDRALCDLGVWQQLYKPVAHRIGRRLGPVLDA